MKKRTKTKRKKRLSTYLLSFLGIFLASVILICGSFLFYFRNQIQAADKEAYDKLSGINDSTFKRVGPTFIYDKGDNQIAKLSALDYIYTKYSDIPELAKYAFIATEDKDFLKNKGISIKGMSRALVSYIKNKGKITQGGSTITQQLVKNVLLTQDKTLSRKLTEILISLEFEKKYTKEQILEYYLNNINFSNGAYSIGSAAKIYFNKPLKELNLAEVTFLSAIPNNPTYYNPLKNYNHVIDRQHLMLDNLKSQKYITEEQYKEALNTKVVLNYQAPKTEAENYMTSYAIDSAIRALMKNDNFGFKYQFTTDKEKNEYESLYNDTYTEYEKKIRSGGYNIYTSFDVDKQNMLQGSLDSGLAKFKEADQKTGLYKMQGAAVCIDNSTGQVIAAVGGRTQKNTTNYFNRAFQAVRQPGSAIKPVLVYAPAFDSGYTPDSTMVDQYIPNGPKNAENTFFGQVTLRYATELSLNTIAYQLLDKETVKYALPYLFKMNFAHIVPEDSGPILGVGGFTYGVTPVELAGAYSTLARGGEFIEPTCIRKIEGENKDIIYNNPRRRIPIYKEETAYYMTDVLKGVLTKNWATGYGLGLSNMTAAGKTGTTSSSKDGWFAGYTPYITTVVWTGYDTPTAIADLYGATYPGHIWQSFMNKVSDGLQNKDFDIPSSIKEQLKEKAEKEAIAAITNAEKAVTDYENINIASKNDYSSADSALINAQNAVSKVSDNLKKGYQDRINVKTDQLNKDKQVIEEALQNQAKQAQTNNNQNQINSTPNNTKNTNAAGSNTGNNSVNSGTGSGAAANTNDTKSNKGPDGSIQNPSVKNNSTETQQNN
ncbi:transglycosylase [Clostridiales bacterium oral taxon 876 str. F0540]|nr:transglycosylase [Clostridiales bacterium oral taxon 876 str. F0540]